MKKLKQLWSRLPRLPRKWKVIRNLAVVLILSLMTVTLFQWPMPTAKLAYQKLERQLLLSPSEVIYSHGERSDRVFVTEGEGWVTAGNVFKTRVNNSPFDEYQAMIRYLYPKDELVLMPLPRPTEHNELVVALTSLPAGTARAEMEIDLVDVPPKWYNESIRFEDETISAQAEPGENGWIFLTFKPHDHGEQECALEGVWTEFWSPFISIESYEYRLYLYDEQGNVLDVIFDKLPEAETMSWH